MRKWLILLPLIGSAVLADEHAGDTPDLATAITSGAASVGIRYRFEHVDQDGFDDDADASTARLRLNYRTGTWRNWSGLVEFDHVFHILLRDFNSGAGTSPGKTGFPVVADPKGSDLNQLYIDFGQSDDWQLRFGRQRILLDNQRFVGGVGWRQNEQTYDGISLTSNALNKTHFFYSYITYVRRIFGDNVSAGRNDVDAHLLNLKVSLNDDWSLTPYAYFIDNDDIAGFSTATFGARVNGKLAAGEGTLTILAELAKQSDAGNAVTDFDADYYHVNAAWALPSSLALGIGFESLGGNSNPGEAFRTPLATLHAFNGWADQFLATPDGGIDDAYVSIKYKAGDWNLTAIYHDFGAETGSGDYGSEIDLSVGRKLGKRYGLLFKGAFFSADSASTFNDTDKFWIMLTASY